MSLQVRLAAALYALGLDLDDVEWHHEPPIKLRPYDAATGKYTPDINDPKHIIPLAKAAHKERTAKIDIPAIAKTKRLSKSTERHNAVMEAKRIGNDKPRDVKKRRMQGRGFQKGHRPFRRNQRA